MTRTGGCMCGAVRYEATGEPQHHALCHCKDCRDWSGAPMMGWMMFQDSQVAVTGTPVTYTSSEHGRREFCGICGTGLFYRNAQMLPGMVDIQSGTLDAPEADPAGAEIMVKERLPWMDDVPGLPKFQSYPGMD